MANKKSSYILGIGVFYISIYFIYQLFTIKHFLPKYDLFIPISDISEINILSRICGDLILVSVPIVVMVIIMSIHKIKWTDMGIRLVHPRILSFLFSIYILLFIIRGDYTYSGIYVAIYYLFIISCVEEIVFRAFLFHWFKQTITKNQAIFTCGLLFGLIHAIVPIAILDVNPLMAILSVLLGGVISGLVFSVMYLRGGTLLIPILVHAILDFTSHI
ncbi:CPBP family intramembrane glutamic endopeptidase [Anaerocolumna sp.]|uniref:CPBP family intramembrane glutamic endopeptidase n=1 Tax=Anaerocolumna sp. TaxID=2041569 RepID=UPI0028AF44C2|nr:CPBP family intramembrane glutamic endopeptidase [Anaerocolumna sp.]